MDGIGMKGEPEWARELNTAAIAIRAAGLTTRQVGVMTCFGDHPIEYGALCPWRVILIMPKADVMARPTEHAARLREAYDADIRTKAPEPPLDWIWFDEELPMDIYTKAPEPPHG